MTDQGGPDQPTAPSQLHLAFALAIVKQKPLGKELKGEYFHTLRPES